jgi:arylsulfatase A-like enzyme
MRIWIAVFACALALATGGGRTTQVHAQAAPNIVVVMTDDLSVDAMNALLAAGMLPNIKAHLIDRGYTFAESYVTNALCCPSRATFLTGQYSHNHGVRGNFPPVGGVTFLNEATALPVWLKRAGYRTGYVGKYLNGYGTLTGAYTPAGWDDWKALIDPFTYSMYRYKVNANGTLLDLAAIADAFGELPQFYQTDIMTVLAATFITSAPQFGQPFFLHVNPLAPHIELAPVYNECRVDGAAGPWFGNFWGATVRPAPRHLNTIFGDRVRFPLPNGPSFNEADLSDKPDWVQSGALLNGEDIGCLEKQYWRALESMRAVDDMVGYIVAALQQTGALSNTVIMFTSDNGFMYGEHRLSQKLAPYDASIRVPLVIRTPWNSTARTIARTVLNNDLAPTIAEWARAPRLVAVDGRSIVPLLQNPTLSPWRGAFLVEHWNDLDEFGGLTLPPDYFGMRTTGTQSRLLVQYPTVTSGSTTEFYNRSVDPHELQSLHAAPLGQWEIALLTPWLNALRTCQGWECVFLETYFPVQ